MKKILTKLIARQCQALCISEFQVPPVNGGAFARVVSPGSGGLAHFARSEGRVFANPGATSKLVCIPIQI